MNPSVKKILIAIVLIAAATGLGYSLYITFQSGATHGLISICDAEKHPGQVCWYGHVHAYIPISLCGEDYRLPTEVGPLTGPHTHEEKNIAHWHGDGGLLYSTTTQQILETQPLTLGAFFDAIDVPFGADRIADTKSPGTCPDGSTATLKMFVNGKMSTAWRDYVWSDHDVIELYFNDRPADDIERELEVHPIEFPALGRG